MKLLQRTACTLSVVLMACSNQVEGLCDDLADKAEECGAAKYEVIDNRAECIGSLSKAEAEAEELDCDSEYSDSLDCLADLIDDAGCKGDDVDDDIFEGACKAEREDYESCVKNAYDDLGKKSGDTLFGDGDSGPSEPSSSGVEDGEDLSGAGGTASSN